MANEEKGYRVRHIFRDPKSGVTFTRTNENQVTELLSKTKIAEYVERGYLQEVAGTSVENPVPLMLEPNDEKGSTKSTSSTKKK